MISLKYFIYAQSLFRTETYIGFPPFLTKTSVVCYGIF